MSKSSIRRPLWTGSLLKCFKNFCSNFFAPLKHGLRDLLIKRYTSSEISFSMLECLGYHILKPGVLQKTEALCLLLKSVLDLLLALVDGRLRQWFCDSSESNPEVLKSLDFSWHLVPSSLWLVEKSVGDVGQRLAIFTRAFKLVRP